MKALELLYQYQQADEIAGGHMSKSIEEAIKELEAHIAVYQVIRKRLDNKVTTLAILQEENRSLLKILTNMNEERIEKGNEKQLRDELCE